MVPITPRVQTSDQMGKRNRRNEHEIHILAAIFILASIVFRAQQSVNEIVFFGGPGMTNTGTQVYSIRADGSGQVNLTNNPAATHLSPNWSPDGTKIVLSINDFLWVMNRDRTSNG